ncbi:OmpH family outer membrane protein [Cryomorphaceae bacterium]|nr:OmpH family outer membrane protein [Cryomorphaceae bacterium]
MKTAMKTLALGLLMMVGTVAAQAQDSKIGHINVDELISLMPETKEAETALQAYAQSLETDLTDMQTELQTKVNNFRANEAVMTELSKETKYKEIQDLDQRIQEYQVKAQQDLQAKEIELLTPVLEKAQNAITEAATEGGFSYILDSSNSKGNVIYNEGGNDIMPAVKAKLGIQ